jgi:hypothetical protein
MIRTSLTHYPHVVIFAFLITMTGCASQSGGFSEKIYGSNQADDMDCNFSALDNKVTVASETQTASTNPTPSALQVSQLVRIIDRDISRKISVRKGGASLTSTSNLNIWTRLLNCTDFPLQLEARVQFLNQSHDPIDDVSAWSRIYLPARSVNNYSEKSVKQAHSIGGYIVEVREGK